MDSEKLALRIRQLAGEHNDEEKAVTQIVQGMAEQIASLTEELESTRKLEAEMRQLATERGGELYRLKACLQGLSDSLPSDEHMRAQGKEPGAVLVTMRKLLRGYKPEGDRSGNVMDFAVSILHGDEKHRAWLLEEAAKWMPCPASPWITFDPSDESTWPKVEGFFNTEVENIEGPVLMRWEGRWHGGLSVIAYLPQPIPEYQP